MYCADRLKDILSGVAPKEWIDNTLLKRLDENIATKEAYMFRITNLYALKNVILYCGDKGMGKKASDSIKKCLRKDERVPNVRFSAINCYLDCYEALDTNVLSDVKKTIKEFEDDSDLDVREFAKKFKQTVNK